MDVVLTKIIEIEKKAQQITDEAELIQKNLDQDIANEKQLLEDEFLKSNKEKVNAFDIEMQNQLNTRTIDLEKKYNEQMESLKNEFNKNSETWKNQLFNSIINN